MQFPRKLLMPFLFLMAWLFIFPLHADQNDSKVFLVYGGKTGWIGQQLVKLLIEQKHTVFVAESRLENREEINNELITIHPDYILNAAGVTGRPNVDWCEDHKQETIRANVIGTLNLVDTAFIHRIPVTSFGTGCIYQYDAAHPIGSNIGFTEEDEPNFAGSYYSKTKIMVDKLLRNYPNVLNLRLRMPISSDFHHRSFITKIINYEKVVNIPNSMTILDDLLPISIEMTLRGLTGTYNFTNPGVISHNEILALYKEYIDPDFTWKNFTLEEQNAILKAERSNNELDASKLLAEFPDIPPIQESIHRVFQKIKKNIGAESI